MKRTILIFCLFILAAPNAPGLQKEFPQLTAPYLGQKPPGITPEIFAPGIVSAEKSKFNAAFSPDGKEFFFSVYEQSGRETMMAMKFMGGHWTSPEGAPFVSPFSDCDPMFSPDGKRLYFISTRPKFKDGKSGEWDIWFVERRNTGWSEPINAGPPINSEYDEYYVSLSNEGTLYFASNRPGGRGSFDIYRSPFANGQHTTPENLGPAINTEHLEQDPFIAPDESYLIFTVADGTDGFGKGDMYISFRKEDSTWTKAKNMGNVLNSDSFDFCPIVSPDGKYFFFTRGGDIYWVASVIIEAFRPKN